MQNDVIEFYVTAYTAGRAFNFPKNECKKLGISGGDTVHLVISEGEHKIFEGRKTLKSGTEIYGSDLAQRIASNAHLKVIASKPTQVQTTLEQAGFDAQEMDAGFQANPEKRRLTEQFAMRRAHRELESRGYTGVRDTSTTQSYDFTCEMDGVLHYVEVKGTQGEGNSVFLTKNEVVHAQNHPAVSIVIVVTNIDLKSEGAERVCFVSPWLLKKVDLLPIIYRWDVPNGICDVVHEANL